MHYSNTQDTIIAPATPPGRSALAVLRLSGPRAISIAEAHFTGRKLSKQPTQTLHVGNLEAPDGSMLDEVVISLFLAPHSYTGDDLVEISCHGSPFIVQRILDRFIQAGARLAEPGEFTQRAFLNGRLDLTQAEGVADLIAADTAAAHRVAWQQLKGGIRRDIDELRQQLLDFAGLIELELDFSEEDVEFADRSQLRGLILQIQERVDTLLESFRYGNAVKQGITTVLAGRPNAGKSTLLNVLLQEERAIVSPIAGTTRDTIEETIVLEGIPFRLIDTAGLREANDEIEAIGVARTLDKVAESTLLLYVFDVVGTSPEEVQADLARLRHDDLKVIAVANKMDLNPYTEASHYTGPQLTEEEFIPVSAINDMNIGYLRERLLEVALDGVTPPEGTVLTSTRHVEALTRVKEALQAVLTGMDSELPGDLLALDLRQALHYLGSVTGTISSDEVLGNIFSRFCIGK